MAVKKFQITDKGWSKGYNAYSMSYSAQDIVRHHFNDGFELEVYPAEYFGMIRVFSNSEENIDWFVKNAIKSGCLVPIEEE